MKIVNGWICRIGRNRVIPIFGDVHIQNGIITKIIQKSFSQSALTQTNNKKDVYNAGGAVITVPQVNFHDHFYSRLAKGLNIKGSMDSFHNILHNLWWKIDRALTVEMVDASAKMSIIESIKSGTTYIFDHHASMNSIDKSLDVIADNLTGHNLRGVLCFEATDRNGGKIAEESLNENIKFIERNENENIRGMLGLHASFTLSDDTLEAASEIVKDYNLGIHIHLCEDTTDRVLSKEITGKFPVQRLSGTGLLNEKSILAHGLYLTKRDCEIIDDMGPSLAFNPDSNLNNSVGTPDFIGLPESIPMLMGTDGMHANPGRSLKNSFLIMRASGISFEETFHRISKIYFDQISFVKKYFEDFPTFTKGDRADLVIWDYTPPTPLTSNNFFGHYIYGILERTPKAVIQSGIFLLKDKSLIGIDENRINASIYEQGEKLFRKFSRMK
jgi:cytosine/adenosine deaminase-related metal-dependent hydrolase